MYSDLAMAEAAGTPAAAHGTWHLLTLLGSLVALWALALVGVTCIPGAPVATHGEGHHAAHHERQARAEAKRARRAGAALAGAPDDDAAEDGDGAPAHVHAD